MANKDLTDFLLTEYENIAKAFFNSYDIGARWVKYYLTILAVPFSFIALIYHSKPEQFDLFNLSTSIAILLLLIGAVNIFVSYVVIDLKLDSVLYARTVNGIRKYFIEQGIKNGQFEPNKPIRSYIVLPTETDKPSFFNLSGDLFIQTVLMISINALYVSIGFVQIGFVKPFYSACMPQAGMFTIIFVLTILVQFVFFRHASKKKERDYCRPIENENTVN
jgi:hypothetical protein